MNFFVFLLTSFIAYLGITIGQYLIFIAPEELVPGRKYFKQWYYFLQYLVSQWSMGEAVSAGTRGEYQMTFAAGSALRWNWTAGLSRLRRKTNGIRWMI